MSERIGYRLGVKVEHTSGGARRIAHRQCIHRQSVLEERFHFFDRLFFGHFLKRPTTTAAVSGSKTGIVMVIARSRSFFIHGLYLIERQSGGARWTRPVVGYVSGPRVKSCVPFCCMTPF